MDTTTFDDETEYDSQSIYPSTSKTASLKRKLDDMEDETPEDERQEGENPDTPMDTPLTTPTHSPTKKACVGVVGSDDDRETPHSAPSQTPDGKKVKARKTPDNKGKGRAVTPNVKIKRPANTLDKKGKKPVNTPNKKGTTAASTPAIKDTSDGSETDDEGRVKQEDANSDSEESVADAVDEPVAFNNNVQPLDPSVADGWNFSTKKKNRILRLLDAHDGNGFAMRRAPSNLRYGTGALKQFLVQAQQPVIIVLVGRVSFTAFLDNKPTVTLNVVPILHEDLQTANNLLAHYSVPQEEPKNYASIRTSARLAKQGLGYKQFSEVYDATGGIRPKDEMKKYPASQIKKGDLVALELAVKKWSGQGETAEHGSYDLKAILLLRKGTATDEAGVEAATAGPIRNAFSSSFYDTLNATS
ncbi:hypothetical protein FRC00_008232 [Tulasnella sp. 408]|nr:hypothetical protein FRC00_008232 [Tulasnella sp. 408]